MLFHVLGPLEVHGGATAHRQVTAKASTLLAILLLQPNGWVTVDELIDGIWPEQDAPASAQANLQTYAWQLRRLLPGGDAPRLTGRPGAYRLRVEPGEIDADRFTSLAAQARLLPPADAAGLLEEALRLWRGRPYDGLAFADAALTRLEQVRAGAREHLAEARAALGDPAEAIFVVLPRRDPMVWLVSMHVGYRCGDQTVPENVSAR